MYIMQVIFLMSEKNPATLPNQEMGVRSPALLGWGFLTNQKYSEVFCTFKSPSTLLLTKRGHISFDEEGGGNSFQHVTMTEHELEVTEYLSLASASYHEMEVYFNEFCQSL